MRGLAAGYVAAAVLTSPLVGTAAPADIALVRQALAVVATHHWNPHLDLATLVRAGVEGLRRELALAGLDASDIDEIPPGLDTDHALAAFQERLDLAVRLAGGRVSERQLLYGGLRAMLKAVGGSHTAFLTPEQRVVFQAILSGKSYSGIGVSFGRRAGQWVISSVVPGAPAEVAGLRRGDVLVSIDGRRVADLVSSEIQLLLIGDPGTSVHVTVLRETERVGVVVVRAPVRRPVVSSRMLPGGLAYLKLYGYPVGAAEEIRTALRDLLARHPRALIVDLRENGGGLVREFLATMSLFLPAGSVVLTEIQRDGIPHPRVTVGLPLVPPTLPLVALIDLGTASNGELTAAALKEIRGAPLIGARTAGELEYSTLEVLPDGSGVRIAYARVLTSRGMEIEGRGYPPDIEVPLDPASVRDVQLEWAVRWVLRQLGTWRIPLSASGEGPDWDTATAASPPDARSVAGPGRAFTLGGLRATP